MEGSDGGRREPRRRPASTAPTPHRSTRPPPTQGGYETFETSGGEEEPHAEVVPSVLGPSESSSTFIGRRPGRLGVKRRWRRYHLLVLETSSLTSPPSSLAGGGRSADGRCHDDRGQKDHRALVAAGPHAHHRPCPVPEGRPGLHYAGLLHDHRAPSGLREPGDTPVDHWCSLPAEYALVSEAGTPRSADSAPCRAGRRCPSCEPPCNHPAGVIVVVASLDNRSVLPCDAGWR
ncbi:hypothetical protein MTO96_005499 [Rhipicephalus appendiculatus]